MIFFAPFGLRRSDRRLVTKKSGTVATCVCRRRRRTVWREIASLAPSSSANRRSVGEQAPILNRSAQSSRSAGKFQDSCLIKTTLSPKIF
jgi:hypothetical protein